MKLKDIPLPQSTAKFDASLPPWMGMSIWHIDYTDKDNEEVESYLNFFYLIDTTQTTEEQGYLDYVRLRVDVLEEGFLLSYRQLQRLVADWDAIIPAAIEMLKER